MLEKNGILERYKEFLQTVGNPHLTDILNREGELIASISFTFRFIVLGNNVNNLISFEEIKSLFETATKLTNNQKIVHNILKNKIYDIQYQQQLSSLISDLLIEIMEQRRKHGFIRVLDKNFQITGNLPTLDLEYISLIVETFNTLYERKEMTKKVITNISLIFENYISRVIATNKNHKLNITLDDINHGNSQYPFISDNKIYWIQSHIHTTATRKSQC